MTPAKNSASDSMVAQRERQRGKYSYLPQVGVTPEVRVALEKLAAADDRSLSDYVRLVLTRHVRDTGQ